MFRREIKVNIKSFLIWNAVLIGIFTPIFLLYPSIFSDSLMGQMEEIMKIFPEKILKAFNMDLSSLESYFGWLKSEGFVFILLIIGCYAGVLGSNILLKEESDKTIEYLSSLPIKRIDIVLKKAVVGIIYISSMVLLVGIINYIGLSISGEFDFKQFIFLSITPLFSSYVIFFLCMFLSTFTHKTKKMMGLSLGVVLFSYALNMFSSLSKTTDFLKYFSVFTLADIRNVIVNVTINPIMIIISITFSIILLLLIINRYNKKELV